MGGVFFFMTWLLGCVCLACGGGGCLWFCGGGGGGGERREGGWKKFSSFVCSVVVRCVRVYVTMPCDAMRCDATVKVYLL